MGGGCIFIYSCSARRVSFQIKFRLSIWKEIHRAEHEYMNIHLPPICLRQFIYILLTFGVVCLRFWHIHCLTSVQGVESRLNRDSIMLSCEVCATKQFLHSLGFNFSVRVFKFTGHSYSLHNRVWNAAILSWAFLFSLKYSRFFLVHQHLYWVVFRIFRSRFLQHNAAKDLFVFWCCLQLMLAEDFENERGISSIEYRLSRTSEYRTQRNR